MKGFTTSRVRGHPWQYEKTDISISKMLLAAITKKEFKSKEIIRV